MVWVCLQRLWRVSEATLESTVLTVSQQPYVVGKHPNTWVSTCLSICTVIWYFSKWLSRWPGMLLQHAGTLPASSAGTWAVQASVLLVGISKVIL